MQYRSIPAFAALLIGMAVSTVANAALITAELTSAQWGDVERGSNLELIDTDSIPGDDLLLWGGAVTAAEKSGYSFLAGGVPVAPLETNQVVLGTFNHLNQTIERGTSIRRASLSLGIRLQLPGIDALDLPLGLTFRHRETSNDCSSSPACANDEVSIEALSSSHPLLTNIGFLTDGGVSMRVSTVEETDNLILLVATVNEASIAVAEPGTLVLLAIGVCVLILVRRRVVPVEQIS